MPMDDQGHELVWLPALAVKDREAELDETKTLLRRFVGVTIAATVVALTSVVTRQPFTGVAPFGVLSTTATVYLTRSRSISQRRRRRTGPG